MKKIVLIILVLGLCALGVVSVIKPAGTGHSHEGDAAGHVQDPKAQISMADESLHVGFVGLLVASAEVLPDQGKLEALYVAGHKYYKMGQLSESQAAFDELGTRAAGTLFEVEALRMRAQIQLGMEEIDLAIADYEQALAVIDAIENLPVEQYEVSLLSFMPMLAMLYETTGNYDQAHLISGRVIDEIHTFPMVTSQAIHGAGRSLMALGRMSEAAVYYQDYIDNYPDEGWTDGQKIEAGRRLIECQGVPWGRGYAQEIQFCADVISDDRYRDDLARYDIGSHLAMILMMKGHVSAAKDVTDSLLIEAAIDIQAAIDSGDNDLRLQLKERAEGQVRNMQVFVLDAWNKGAEAKSQLLILQGDAEFGEYSGISETQISPSTLP